MTDQFTAHAPLILAFQPENNPSNQSLGGPVAGASPAAQPGASTTPSTTGGPTNTSATPPSMGYFPFLMFAGILGLMLFTSWRSNKSEKKRRADLLENLSKGDEVQTLGGEIGTIVDVRDQEVVIKFEDSKVRFVKSAIAVVRKPAHGKSGAPGSIEPKDAKEPAKA